MRSRLVYIEWLYVLLLAVHCIAIFEGWDLLGFATKLTLAPMMIGMMAASNQKIPALVYAAFIFCWIGDALLIGKGDTFFIAGMLAFIIAHLCNSINFYRLQHGHCRMREAVAAAVVLMLLCAIQFAILNPYLGSLRLPVLIYMLVISIMAILAASTAGQEKIRPVTLSRFLPGAGLFVLSDSLLAINTFIVHDSRIDIPVMLLYGMALYFLASGFVRAASVIIPAGAGSRAKN